MTYDLLIKNGRVIDGSGRVLRNARYQAGRSSMA